MTMSDAKERMIAQAKQAHQAAVAAMRKHEEGALQLQDAELLFLKCIAGAAERFLKQCEQEKGDSNNLFQGDA